MFPLSPDYPPTPLAIHHARFKDTLEAEAAAAAPDAAPAVMARYLDTLP